MRIPETYGMASELNQSREFTFLKRMSGTAQSLFVRDRLGHHWIIKLRSRLQGPNALANELIGSRICRALALPVPEAQLVSIPACFFSDQNTWLRTTFGYERPESGSHFASRFFPEERRKAAIDHLPRSLQGYIHNRSDCFGMFAFDVWAVHTDCRQALYLVDGTHIVVGFIDHGHLFGGPNWSGTQCLLRRQHLQMTALHFYDDKDAVASWFSKMEDVVPKALQAAMKEIPKSWYTGSLTLLERTFLRRLKYLPSLIEEAIVNLRGQQSLLNPLRIMGGVPTRSEVTSETGFR